MIIAMSDIQFSVKGDIMDIEAERAHGRKLYRAGRSLGDCRNRAQSDGWKEAELAGALAYLSACERDGLPAVQVVREMEMAL